MGLFLSFSEEISSSSQEVFTARPDLVIYSLSDSGAKSSLTFSEASGAAL